ncbi:hypothetical protein BGZ76_010893 [Entomortierella beljakovae]|nr:hypothetical protein BGZ76_010893 [Entomortierella beljakovae]
MSQALHNIRQEKIKPPPKEKTCNWCRESIHLDAFRCKYCQSFVKDIPGVEDAGVGMFVTIKKPKQQHSQSPTLHDELPPLPHEHIAANDVALAEKAAANTSTTTLAPKCSSSPTSTLGPSNGKKVAEELEKMNNP